jgi:ribosomal protein S27E
MAAQGKTLPFHVQQEFAEYHKYGRLEYGFLRVQCSECHHEHLVAFSCKRRGFCPNCGARRMAESAALLVDEVLPEQPIRQWVLSFPFQLRFLFASCPQLMGRVLGIVYRAISAHLIRKAGFTRKRAQTGAVTLIQRFGGAQNLNVHFHMLFLEGVYTTTPWGKSRFHHTNAPTQQELIGLVHTINHRVGGFLEREGILERDEENSDFIAKLAALVPKPGVNLTRFHGVFAPNSKYRVEVTPAKRGKGRPHPEGEEETPEHHHQAMTWAQRLKRVFNIDVSICLKCGGEAKVIASIEDQVVIDKIPSLGP